MKSGEFLRKISHWSKTSMNWYRFSYRREGKNDPYKSLCLTIFLQRTRAEKVEEAYRNFFKRFPSIESLARAKVKDVIDALDGIGLQRMKARRLKRLAHVVLTRHGGRIPSTREGLMNLPGVGEYTADIVSSLTFGEDVIAVDVNVVRILKRVGLIQRDDEVKPFLETIITRGQRPRFNKILLEFGMTVCRARPKCVSCPLTTLCRHFKEMHGPFSSTGGHRKNIV